MWWASSIPDEVVSYGPAIWGALTRVSSQLVWLIIVALVLALIGVGVEYEICRHTGQQFPHARLAKVLVAASLVASAGPIAEAIFTQR